MQLRKEHDSPFHEFIMVVIQAGYTYRVDRGREVGPVLDALKKQGVPSVDTIALLHLTSLEELDGTSYCAIELCWGSDKMIDLKLVLDICFQIHNKSGPRYKLLTHNCYFFAQTIIMIVVRKTVSCKLDKMLEEAVSNVMPQRSLLALRARALGAIQLYSLEWKPLWEQLSKVPLKKWEWEWLRQELELSFRKQGEREQKWVEWRQQQVWVQVWKRVQERVQEREQERERERLQWERLQWERLERIWQEQERRLALAGRPGQAWRPGQGRGREQGWWWGQERERERELEREREVQREVQRIQWRMQRWMQELALQLAPELLRMQELALELVQLLGVQLGSVLGVQLGLALGKLLGLALGELGSALEVHLVPMLGLELSAQLGAQLKLQQNPNLFLHLLLLPQQQYKLLQQRQPQELHDLEDLELVWKLVWQLTWKALTAALERALIGEMEPGWF
jgi:hypothetical protein